MSPKVKGEGIGPEGYRTEKPEKTLSRIEVLTKRAGISRIADITGLDRIGIPVFSAIRPSAETGAISIYNGKGLTPTQARISAIMEGIERYSAELHEDVLIRESMQEMLNSDRKAIDPMELILPIYTLMRLKDMPIAWLKGKEIDGEEDIMVPASAVFHPYNSTADLLLFRSNTNGLASGNTIQEATLHGLCEVVERDAWSLSEVKRKVVSDIVVEEEGVLKQLLEKFTSKGIEVHLKNLTSDIGMPVIAAAADDVQLQDAGLLTLGIGAHPSPQVAALKALTEVAQSRLTQIHGAREDAVMADGNRKLGYERVKHMNQLWFGKATECKDISEIKKTDKGDLDSNIAEIVGRIHQIGLQNAIIVDLTRKEIGMPVVRVIVPGLEVFSIDSDRVGRRLMEAEREVRGRNR
jgi:ribosomal protein S12 methylthiotransferase accessory factor